MIDIDNYIDYRIYYGQYVRKMSEKGLGLCPFHDDSSPSFQVNFTNGQWRCFAGCGHGNVYSFEAEIHGETGTKEAAIRLHKIYVDKETCHDSNIIRLPTHPPKTEAKPEKPKIIPEETWELFPPLSEDWIQKLRENRGWSKRVIKMLDIRLGTHMRLKDGTVRPVYGDPDRVAIPVRNENGELVNIRRYKPFGGCREGESKIYSWGQGFGSNRHLIHIFDPDAPIFDVEGEPDWICALSHGLNASTMTAKPTKWVPEHLEPYRGKKVFLAHDADQAGQVYGAAALENLSGVADSVERIDWPDYMLDGDGNYPEKHGQDLTDFFVKHKGEVANLLHNFQVVPNQQVPTIVINEHPLPEMAAMAWDLFRMRNDHPEVFRHSLGVVQVIKNENLKVLTIKPLNTPAIRYYLARYANWAKVTGRSKDGPLTDHCLPPNYLCEDMLSTPTNKIPIPYLEKVVNHPFFTKSGSLQMHPGYVIESQAFYFPTSDEPPKIAKVPDTPTEADLECARFLIDELIGDFPWVSESDKAGAIAYMLLPFCRELVEGPTPLHLFEAPTPGTGKSLLVSMLAFPAIGRDVETMTEGHDEEEWRKRLTSKFMNSTPYILIDNVQYRLSSSTLAAAITSNIWEDRILGKSATLYTGVKWGWAATGNNTVLSSEMARRTIPIRMDSGTPNPWERDQSSYRHPNLREWAKENHAELIWANLTLIQNWIAKGKPDGCAPPLGSFEGWTRVIGGILDSGGYPGFLKNLAKFYDNSDSERATYQAFVDEWYRRFGGEPVGVAHLFVLIDECNIPIFVGNGNDRSQKIRFGHRIKALRDRQFGDLRICAAGTYQGAQQWRLERIERPGGGDEDKRNSCQIPESKGA